VHRDFLITLYNVVKYNDITVIVRNAVKYCDVNTLCGQSVELLNVKPVGKGKGKAIPLQAWTGPEGSRRLRL
jgi:hypothetical protein